MSNRQASFARDVFELRQLGPEISGRENQQKQDGSNHENGSIIVRDVGTIEGERAYRYYPSAASYLYPVVCEIG